MPHRFACMCELLVFVNCELYILAHILYIHLHTYILAEVTKDMANIKNRSKGDERDLAKNRASYAHIH